MEDVAAVVTDLFFQSRIAAAANAAERRVRFFGPEAAMESLPGIRLYLVDLDAGGDVLGAIRRIKAQSEAEIVAFGPHIDTERRKAARAAGAHRVLAKSKFVTELPVLMAGVPTSR